MDNGPWFYPDPVFAWIFYAVLLGFLAVATYTDIGSLRIPKWLTLSMLGVGLVFSVVRGVWMGSLLEQTGSPLVVWHFAQSPVLGALDGLLCAVEGFLAALGLFVVLYALGAMRGGDVKLMAALGVWVGPVIVLLVILGTVPVLLVLGTVLLLRKMFRRGVQKTVFNVKEKAQGTNLKKRSGGKQRAEVWLAYSLPVMLSAGLLLVWVILHDQQHPVPPKKAAATEQASAQP
jgi:prepilin peptidase CpaA